MTNSGPCTCFTRNSSCSRFSPRAASKGLFNSAWCEVRIRPASAYVNRGNSRSTQSKRLSVTTVLLEDIRWISVSHVFSKLLVTDLTILSTRAANCSVVSMKASSASSIVNSARWFGDREFSDLKCEFSRLFTIKINLKLMNWFTWISVQTNKQLPDDSPWLPGAVVPTPSNMLYDRNTPHPTTPIPFSSRGASPCCPVSQQISKNIEMDFVA